MSDHRHTSLIDEFPGTGQLQNLTLSADVRGGSPGPLRKRGGIDDETNGPGGRFVDAN